MMEITELFKYIRKEIAKYTCQNWDFYLIKDNNRQISYHKQSIEDFKESSEVGYAVRLLKDNKISLAYGNLFNKEQLSQTISKASYILKYITPNEHFRIQDNKPKIDSQKFNNNQTFFSVATSQKISILKNMEKNILKSHPSIKKIEHLGFSESCNTTYYFAKNIDLLTDQGNYYGYVTDVIAENRSEQETGSAFQFETEYTMLNPDIVVKEATYNAYSMLGAKPIKSGKYHCVLKNNVMASFLSVFSPLFSAEEVQNNKSVLKGKVKEQIASSKVTLIDDATLKNGLNTTLFDGEGIPSSKKTLIGEGYLLSYLYDLKSATQDNTNSTGNGIRSSYSIRPTIKPTNLILNLGIKSKNDLIKIHNKDTLFINNVMGMHTVNKINGDFSVGATGYIIHDGIISSPIKQFTIAGNFLNLLKDIEEIGNDQYSFPWGANIITPSVLVTNLSVSGL